LTAVAAMSKYRQTTWTDHKFSPFLCPEHEFDKRNTKHAKVIKLKNRHTYI